LARECRIHESHAEAAEKKLQEMQAHIDHADAYHAAMLAAQPKVKPLVWSDFREGGCVGKPYPFQFVITQAFSNGRYLCHHDTSWHDVLAVAQAHAEAAYQIAVLEPAVQSKPVGDGITDDIAAIQAMQPVERMSVRNYKYKPYWDNSDVPSHQDDYDALEPQPDAAIREAALRGARKSIAAIRQWSPYGASSAETAAWRVGATSFAEAADKALLALIETGKETK
jgi:hypothetical protein